MVFVFEGLQSKYKTHQSQISIYINHFDIYKSWKRHTLKLINQITGLIFLLTKIMQQAFFH